MSEAQAMREYIERHATMQRKELLHLCRMGGISAHKINANEQLVRLLWCAFGRPAFLRDQRNKALCKPQSSKQPHI